MKIANNVIYVKSTARASLFAGEYGKFWVPKSAIVDIRRHGGYCDVVVDNWYNNNHFRHVPLSELIDVRQPADVRWVTNIPEQEFPQDLIGVQREAVQYASKLRRCLIWLWTGCGKTKIGIEIANTLYQCGLIRRLYWITPHYERALPQLNREFSRWLNASIELKIISINWFSYNYDEFIGDDDCVIIDEVHKAKNGITAGSNAPECKLANNIRVSISAAGYVYGLTADSCTNGALDLFGIFYCIQKSIVIPEGCTVKSQLKMKGNQIIGVRSMLKLIESVSPYIFHRRKSDYDNRVMRHYDYKLMLSSEQSKQMNDLYIRSRRVIAQPSIVDVYVLMARCCYRAGGAGMKQGTLKQILSSIPNDDRVIIFGYTVNGKYSDIALIRQALREYGESFIELHGDIGDNDNAVAIESFRGDRYRCLVASYGCGAELLDFPNANHVILFGHSLNPVHRRQAIGRIDRINQKKQCHVYNIFIYNSVEGYVNDLFVRKMEVSSDISNFMNDNTKVLNNEIS